jgi:hypothetical protein
MTYVDNIIFIFHNDNYAKNDISIMQYVLILFYIRIMKQSSDFLNETIIFYGFIKYYENIKRIIAC